MKDEFVTFDIAMAMRELGFDEPCLAHYYVNDKHFDYMASFNNPKSNSQYHESRVTAPLWQQAFKWFRTKYGIDGQVSNTNAPEPEKWCYDVARLSGGILIMFSPKTDKPFDSYELAVEDCILKMINLVKENAYGIN